MENEQNFKKPELTVVVIAYNNELYIEEALESLHEQTFQDMEVVVVNDASTDRTGEIIEEYIADKPKFKVIHLEENSGGCSVPRNIGIANSSGKYLMFLDGDDWYTKDACEKMVAAIKRTDSDFVSGQVIRTNNYEIWYHRQIFSRERININIREFPELFFDSLSVNKIYKRSFLDKHKLRFPEGIHYEDIVFTGKAYFLAESISVVPVPIYYWRVVENAKVKSITNRRFDIDNFKNRISAHRLLDQFIIENGDTIYLAHKNNKFLRHDLKLYCNDYLEYDEEYKKEFHEIIHQYLNEHINKYEFIELEERSRIMYFLLYINDVEAFKDYIAYINGKPTKEYRLRHNGEFYYFYSEKSREIDHKFLRVNNPAVSYSIRNVRLDKDKFEFEAEVHLDSVPDDEILYYWRLKHKQSGTFLYSSGTNQNKVTFNLRDLDYGNYYLSLIINHNGIIHKKKVYRLNAQHFPNQKVEDGNNVMYTFISQRNLIGFKVEPLNQTAKIKWAYRRFKKKVQSGKGNNAIKEKLLAVTKRVMKKLPLRENWILFESHMGKQFSDSPKYIYQGLLNTNKKYKYIWSFENPDSIEIPGPAIKVKRRSLKHYYYMVRSKYWVDNQGIAHLVPKKKGQIYLQTWHGTPLKKMGYDQEKTNPNELKKLKIQSGAWDYFISPNSYSTEIFKRAFMYSGNVMETGYPRNDILIQQPQEIINKVKNDLGIHNKKVILFAPTFRDWKSNSFQDTLRDIKILSSKLDENTVLLLRLHYLLSNQVSQMSLPDNIINVSNYPDIQELCLISDMLITDYSSVMFDYALLERPIILYCYDLEEYRFYRGVYFDITKNAPGPVCKTINELVNFINNPEHFDQYKENLQAFRQKFGHLEDGHATDRVINKVFK